VLPRNTIQVTIEQWLSDRSVLPFCLVFVLQKKVKDTANKKWSTHFEGVGINVLNHETKILVNAALVNQFEVFMTLFQQRNDRINDCQVFFENNTVISICENNVVFSKEDTFINLTLVKVTSDKSFTELLEPVVAILF
jgi:hypothetical protein